LACGTLARDVEDCQMQMVAVKPIARWQIWLGKWLGLLMLNAALLVVAGGSVYALLQWRAHPLPPGPHKNLRREIFVARASLKAQMPDMDSRVEEILREQIKKTPVPPSEQPELRKQLREQVKAVYQLVPPGYTRDWGISLGLRRFSWQDEPLFLR